MRDPEVLEFTDADVSPIVAVVTDLSSAGAGWVNLEPAVDPNDVGAPRGALSSWFTRNRPEATRATWVAAPPPERPSVGIQHGASVRVRDVVAEYNLAVPDGWRVVQDNPRRGFVAEVPTDDHTAVLEWLLAAATALATVPLTGRWRAEVHRR